MSAIRADEAPRVVKRRFYLTMALLIAAIIVGGFSRTLPGALEHGMPLLLHVHGAVFVCWLLLFVAQPALVANGSLALHRKLGMLGAVLAVAMFTMGVAAVILAVRLQIIPPFFPPTLFVAGNFVNLIVFAGLVAAGIATRKQPEWHKRLMLCASVSLLGPGIGRLAIDSAVPVPLAIVVVQTGFALAGPAVDWFSLKRVHPAYLWGAGALVVMQVVTPAAAFSPVGAWMLKLVG